MNSTRADPNDHPCVCAHKRSNNEISVKQSSSTWSLREKLVPEIGLFSVEVVLISVETGMSEDSNARSRLSAEQLVSSLRVRRPQCQLHIFQRGLWCRRQPDGGEDPSRDMQLPLVAAANPSYTYPYPLGSRVSRIGHVPTPAISSSPFLRFNPPASQAENGGTRPRHGTGP